MSLLLVINWAVTATRHETRATEQEWEGGKRHRQAFHLMQAQMPNHWLQQQEYRQECKMTETKSDGRVGSTLLYMRVKGRAEFISRPGYRLYCLRPTWIPLPLQTNSKLCLKLGHKLLFSHLFQNVLLTIISFQAVYIKVSHWKRCYIHINARVSE
jgi:hypothetical protein